MHEIQNHLIEIYYLSICVFYFHKISNVAKLNLTHKSIAKNVLAIQTNNFLLLPKRVLSYFFLYIERTKHKI